MTRIYTTFFFTFFTLSFAFGQEKEQKVFTSDIDNFWVAYDSIHTTTDSLKQLQYLQALYIDKGTPGVQGFMEAKGYTAEQWVTSIRSYPKFWNSVRPNTLLAKSGAQGLEPYLKKLKKLYPALRPAGIYFCIGVLSSGGTTQDSMILIGAEIATGNSSTDISEFPESTQKFLSRVYKGEPFKNIIPVNVHEYVHTQQKGLGSDLLGRAILEGTCDFVAELVTGITMPLSYMEYGPKHEAELKQKFKAEMFEPGIGNWFYNQQAAQPDLGYYMGYAICKAYYKQAKNKQQAIKDMIELKYDDAAAVEAFLAKSKFYQEPIRKAELQKAYEARQPVITRISPLSGPDSLIDASVQEIRIEFSAEMDRFTATDYGTGGKEQFPVVAQPGFSADKRTYVYKVRLEPGREYSFRMNGGGFRSLDGYPLNTYEVRFRTKK